MTEKVLIVEDDESILEGLELNLETEGYQVLVARDGETAVERFQSETPDLVLLDLMLPALDGFQVLSIIRRKDPEIPVLILSARDTEREKITGLNLGADDYITKPFALPELLARINAALRRRRGAVRDIFGFGDITIDHAQRRVTRGGEALEMTTREYELLIHLVRAKNRVLSRGQILEAVWGRDYEGTERTVDNFIARLRTKLETDPERPKFLETVRGVGYRLSDEP